MFATGPWQYILTSRRTGSLESEAHLNQNVLADYATVALASTDPDPGQRWTLRRPGPHLDQNVLGQLRGSSPGLDSEPLGWPLFRCRTARSAPVLLFGRKRGTRKSRLETKT